MKLILSFIFGGLIIYTFTFVLIQDNLETEFGKKLQEKWAMEWEELHQVKSRYLYCKESDWKKSYDTLNHWMLNNCLEEINQERARIFNFKKN